MLGKVRVSTRKDGMPLPKFEGYKNITVIMKSHSVWWELSPYYLKNDEGHLMENIWQYSKVYEVVPKSRQVYSRFDQRVIWEYPEERHLSKEDNSLTDNYWNWRKMGFENEFAVRYPVGYHNRGLTLFSIKSREDQRQLTYTQARREIYLPEYCRLVKKEKRFAQLQALLRKGQNINIIEIDGPVQSSLDYYIEEYGVPDDWFTQSSVEVTEENMKILIDDTKHSFGHGYCLGIALLGIEV